MNLSSPSSKNWDDRRAPSPSAGDEFQGFRHVRQGLHKLSPGWGWGWACTFILKTQRKRLGVSTVSRHTKDGPTERCLGTAVTEWARRIIFPGLADYATWLRHREREGEARQKSFCQQHLHRASPPPSSPHRSAINRGTPGLVPPLAPPFESSLHRATSRLFSRRFCPYEPTPRKVRLSRRENKQAFFPLA